MSINYETKTIEVQEPTSITINLSLKQAQFIRDVCGVCSFQDDDVNELRNLLVQDGFVQTNRIIGKLPGLQTRNVLWEAP